MGEIFHRIFHQHPKPRRCFESRLRGKALGNREHRREPEEVIRNFLSLSPKPWDRKTVENNCIQIYEVNNKSEKLCNKKPWIEEKKTFIIRFSKQNNQERNDVCGRFSRSLSFTHIHVVLCVLFRFLPTNMFMAHHKTSYTLERKKVSASNQMKYGEASVRLFFNSIYRGFWRENSARLFRFYLRTRQTFCCPHSQLNGVDSNIKKVYFMKLLWMCK